MKTVVIEGPDNTGKSTLAEDINHLTGWPVIPSEGREKWPGEINERVRRYNRDYPSGVIFDRHPVVSQSIYNAARVDHRSTTPIDGDLIDEFYKGDNLIIYSRRISGDILDDHIVKDHDDETYIRGLRESAIRLRDTYDAWALKRAHFIWRIPHDPHDYQRLIELMFDPVRDVEAFHEKFGLAYNGPPRPIPMDLLEFRYKFMHEELKEYSDYSFTATAIERSTRPDQPGFREAMEKSFDGLIDLDYVLLGTNYLHGFDYREGWRRVHYANMQKVRAEKAEDSLRGSTYDVVKPDGWQPPSLTDLVS